MIMMKLWTLFLAHVLIICQMCVSQAALSRSGKDSIMDGSAVSNDDTQSLLRAITEFMQVTSDEQGHQAVDDSSPDRSLSKRCTGLSTCVLGKLSQDIHKLQTYPRTNVGSGTPGKKRSLSEHYDVNFDYN